MAHNLTAIILKGKFSLKKALYYDLTPIYLKYDLTLFIINIYFTEYWQCKILKKRSTLDLNLADCPTMFPTDQVIAYIVKDISLENALFAVIFTEYHGGVGIQFASIFEGYINKNKSITRINDALAALGVIREDDLDEFDTLGLSLFRREPAYLEKYYTIMDDLKF